MSCGCGGIAGDLDAILGGDGSPVTLRSVTSEYDPVSGTNQQVATDREVSALVTSYTVEETDGNLVLHGDQKVVVAASQVPGGIDPSASVLIDGSVWAIKSVRTRRFAGEVFSYVLQVRR